MKIGEFIKQERTRRELSLRDLAAKVKCDPAYLSRIESGRVKPSGRLIQKLAPVLGYSADDLALLSGRVPPKLQTAIEQQAKDALDRRATDAVLHVAESRAEYGAPKKGRKTKKIATKVSQATASLHLSFADAPRPNDGVIHDREEAAESKSETESPRSVHPRNALNALTASEWIADTVSVWTQRGLGAGHADAQIERQHPAPFSFTDVARLVKFFSKPGDLVLDPFVGVGSTLKACAIEGRRGLGIELNPKYAQLARERLQTELGLLAAAAPEQTILEGDARSLALSLPPASVDLIVTSPPYWNILHKEDHKANQERKANALDTRYSNDKRDLGNIKDYSEFLEVLTDILGACCRALKPKKYLAIVVSDFRDKSRFIMFHADLASALAKHGVGLRGIKVLYQRHKKVFPYGYPYAYVPNIHHQYILILQNER
jgi:DNA modification methylase/transcriptional regulator with XRE-family HTH domain